MVLSKTFIQQLLLFIGKMHGLFRNAIPNGHSKLNTILNR
jgi:hypothetical protein